MLKEVHLFSFLLLALATAGCKRKSTNPEMEIRALIERTEKNVETEDLDSIKASISSEYTDGKGFNKRKIVGALQFQFLRKSSIHLLTRIIKINIAENGDEAEVSVLVAMAGRAVQSIDSLKGIRANLMRFKFGLVKDGEWLVRSSSWGRAKLGDFMRAAVQPESDRIEEE